MNRIIDDLHIAVNRNPDVYQYQRWSIFDMFITSVISISPFVFLIRQGKFGLCVATFVAVSLILFLSYRWLDKNYKETDAFVRKIYNDRVSSGYYDTEWVKGISLRKEDDTVLFDKQYIDLYTASINKLLIVHFLIALATLIVGVLAGGNLFATFFAALCQITQGVLAFRSLQILLNGSFSAAYTLQFKRPRI